MMPETSGLGDPHAHVKVYIGNRPDFAEFLNISSVRPLQKGEINSISNACGNGWRKVFNVYAKFIYALPGFPQNGEADWQSFRDNRLLQEGSGLSLLFSSPDVSDENSLHILMGKHYSLSLDLPDSLLWLDHEFAIDRQHKLIVCPYFDYRQLSNAKIIRLVELIQTHALLMPS